MIASNTTCPWYGTEAEAAARFYASVFRDREVTAAIRSPMDNAGNDAGDVLVVRFSVCGIPCLGRNGGCESECGGCKDRWGVNWQIAPRTLTEALTTGGEEGERAFAVMMTMRKHDVATIGAARRV